MFTLEYQFKKYLDNPQNGVPIKKIQNLCTIHFHYHYNYMYFISE